MDADVQRLADPVDYIQRFFPGKPIFRYIQTHPDMDHMAGLYRLVKLERIDIYNFWDTHHCIEKEESARKWQNVNFDIRDWQVYQEIRRQESNPTVLRLMSGTKGHFYAEDGISIWAPFDNEGYDNPDADPNQFSYVLHVKFGTCSIVLGGDLPEPRWQQLYNRFGGKYPKVHLLKPSHHGRKSGYHRESIKAMSPDISVVSVGELKGKDDAAASYERFSNVGCFSTVDHGTIIATCWEDGDVWLNDSMGNRIHGPAWTGALAAISGQFPR